MVGEAGVGHLQRAAAQRDRATVAELAAVAGEARTRDDDLGVLGTDHPRHATAGLGQVVGEGAAGQREHAVAVDVEGPAGAGRVPVDRAVREGDDGLLGEQRAPVDRGVAGQLDGPEVQDRLLDVDGTAVACGLVARQLSVRQGRLAPVTQVDRAAGGRGRVAGEAHVRDVELVVRLGIDTSPEAPPAAGHRDAGEGGRRTLRQGQHGTGPVTGEGGGGQPGADEADDHALLGGQRSAVVPGAERQRAVLGHRQSGRGGQGGGPVGDRPGDGREVSEAL